MRKNFLKSIITLAVTTSIISCYSIIDANATWIQNSEKKWLWSENNHNVTGWKNINGQWYYFNSNGIMKTGWLKLNNTWYYLKPSGAMATGWIKDGSTWYYMKSDGTMATGWLNKGTSWYYLKSGGAMATGWVKDGSSWYYLKSSGEMATGWIKDGSSWYYLKSGGEMKTGWLKDGVSWYYLKSSGEMATGWVSVDNSKYYLNENGQMVTGQLKIDGVIYNFNSSGVLTSETNSNNPSNDKEEGRKAYVVTENDPLNLRESPSTNSTIISRIPKNSEIVVISEEINGFYKIIWNSKTGYVSSNWISFEKSGSDNENNNDDIEDGYVPSIRKVAPNEDDKYYYSNSNIFYSAKLSPPFTNSNGKPIIGNCTWYAWGRIWELTGKRPIDAGFTGNAYEWWDANKKSDKYQYGSTPKVGSLAVWKSSLANSGGCGHVAIVEKIEDGKIYISESSWHGSLFKYREIYDVNDLYGYIYINQPNY